MVVIGTRPEAIKMAPVIKELQKEAQNFETIVCATSQHKEMLKQTMDVFNIKPDIDLNIMKENQNLHDLTSDILLEMRRALIGYNPDIVLVQGDTTTTMASTLASFYMKKDVGHVEAGLRTGNLFSPWPEEANRKIVSVLAKYHFAPTKKARENLLKEGVNEDNILITGNTVIDALFLALEIIENDNKLKLKILNALYKEIGNSDFDVDSSTFVLITSHRRENFNEGIINICEAIKELALQYKDIYFIYPVHLNPNIQRPVNDILGKLKNIILIKPLDYFSFVYLMSRSFLILTDSGGIQEEAPSLGKPVLVMRDFTERPEALEAGTIKLVGTNKESIINGVSRLLDNDEEYDKMAKKHNPYGDGKAAKRIVDFLRRV